MKNQAILDKIHCEENRRNGAKEKNFCFEKVIRSMCVAGALLFLTAGTGCTQAGNGVVNAAETANTEETAIVWEATQEEPDSEAATANKKKSAVAAVAEMAEISTSEAEEQTWETEEETSETETLLPEAATSEKVTETETQTYAEETTAEETTEPVTETQTEPQTSESRSEEETTLQEITSQKEEESTSSVLIAETIGNISQSFVDKTNEMLSVIPENLKETFVESGWHFYISEADVGSTYAPEFGCKLKGLTIVEWQTIYLDYRDSALSAAVHEFGHFVDVYLGWPSLSEEFSDIYNAERKTFNSTFSYKAGNVQELFAESFKRFCTEKSTLMSSCPQIYTFLEEILP